MEMTSAMGKAMPITTSSLPYRAESVVVRASLKQHQTVICVPDAKQERCALGVTVFSIYVQERKVTTIKENQLYF